MNHNDFSPTLRGTVYIIHYFCSGLYSSEVGNNDFWAFPFLCNQLHDQTMNAFIAVVREEFRKNAIRYNIVIIKLHGFSYSV